MESNEKKIKILQIAEKMFSENGFDGTSVRKIAKEAGINVAMISYYFGSKEKLLSALLSHRSTDFKKLMDKVLSTNLNYFQKVDELVKAVVERAHDNRRINKIIHFEHSHKRRKLNTKNLTAQKKAHYKALEEFIKKGQSEGVFSKEVNIPLIVPTILGTYFNLFYNRETYQEILGYFDETSFENYINNSVIPHLQKTIKALLTYEN